MRPSVPRRRGGSSSAPPKHGGRVSAEPPRSSPPGGVRDPRGGEAEPRKLGGEFRGPRRQKSPENATLPLMCSPRHPCPRCHPPYSHQKTSL